MSKRVKRVRIASMESGTPKYAGNPFNFNSLVSSTGRIRGGMWNYVNRRATTTTTTTTAPAGPAAELSNISMASNNSISTIAMTGDVVTLTFTASETIDEPEVTFQAGGDDVQGSVVYINTSGNTWEASYTVDTGDTSGDITYSIEFTNAAGVVGTVTSGPVNGVSTGPSWDQIGQTMNGEDTGDKAGYSVSLSNDGSIMAFGAIKASATSNGGAATGHVRVFQWRQYNTTTDAGIYHHMDQVQDGGANNPTDKPLIITGGSAPSDATFYWTQLGKDIDGDNTTDESGFSVSLSGDGTKLAISSIEYDIATTGNGGGCTKVWQRDVANTTVSPIGWTLIGNIPGEAEGDESGYSVSLNDDGSIIAIGAPKHDIAAAGNGGGNVRIYEDPMNGGVTWTLIGDLNGVAEGDEFGYSVSLSGDGSRVAIGAPKHDTTASGGGTNSGLVKVYEYATGTTWNDIGTTFSSPTNLTFNGEAQDDLAGSSVSLSSNGLNLAIGIIQNKAGVYGKVRVWGEISGTWTQIGSDITGSPSGTSGLSGAGGPHDSSWSGYSVKLSSGLTLAIGEPHYGYITGIFMTISDPEERGGKVKVLQWNGATWGQIGDAKTGGTLVPYGVYEGENLGRAIAFSSDGSKLVMGSYYGGQGPTYQKVRVYEIK